MEIFEDPPPKCWRSDRGGLEGKIVSKNYGQTRATLRKSENPFTEKHYSKSGEESLARGFLKTECLKSIRFWTFDGVRPLLDKGILQKYHTSSSVLTIFVTPPITPHQGDFNKTSFSNILFLIKNQQSAYFLREVFQKVVFFLEFTKKLSYFRVLLFGKSSCWGVIGGVSKIINILGWFQCFLQKTLASESSNMLKSSK